MILAGNEARNDESIEVQGRAEGIHPEEGRGRCAGDEALSEWRSFLHAEGRPFRGLGDKLDLVGQHPSIT